MFEWIKCLKELSSNLRDVNYLMKRIKDLQNDIDIINKRVEELNRIVEYAREDEIHESVQFYNLDVDKTEEYSAENLLNWVKKHSKDFVYKESEV